MDSNLTVTANGKVYCAFCARALSVNEECHCKGAENARIKAEKKARNAQKNSSNNVSYRPPRVFNK